VQLFFHPFEYFRPARARLNIRIREGILHPLVDFALAVIVDDIPPKIDRLLLRDPGETQRLNSEWRD